MRMEFTLEQDPWRLMVRDERGGLHPIRLQEPTLLYCVRKTKTGNTIELIEGGRRYGLDFQPFMRPRHREKGTARVPLQGGSTRVR